MASKSPSFPGPREVHSFAGVLLDLDGTIVDSTDAIVKHWHRQVCACRLPIGHSPRVVAFPARLLTSKYRLGKELGVDPNVIMQTSHGRRSIDTLALYDPSKANWDYVSYIEGLIPKEYGQDAQEIPGARGLLADLEAIDAPWGIVTSGTRALMTGWLQVMQLSFPRVHVVAEDVEKGKPDPACYALGIQRLGLQRAKGAAILVIEDAPAGIRAGKAAGCQVVGLTTTHPAEQIRAAGADWIVRDLRSVQLVGSSTENGNPRLEIAIEGSMLL